MPQYDYYCPECGNEWENFHAIPERLNEKCPVCGEGGHIDLGRTVPAIHIWKPVWVEDMDVEPYYAESRQKYKDELKRKGMVCHDLM